MNSAMIDTFEEFFVALHGYAPYQWQIRLLEEASDGEWPNLVSAPTGSGKTTIIDVHVFLNAFAGKFGIPTNMARRLCLVVNRRALVDSQFEYAQDVARRLEEALTASGNADPVVLQAAEGLVKRKAGKAEMPLVTGSLRGGGNEGGLARSWRTKPESVMIICATPDMFGSRLLFRGYGVSQNARPQEAGLLAYDTVLVVDEAHLNEQLVFTARQVARIEALARLPFDEGEFPLRPLQVMESTATPVVSADADKRIVSVTEQDLQDSPTLCKRLTCMKRLECVLHDGGKQYEQDIVDQCLSLGETASPVGVIVNTVPLALGVAEKLREHCDSSSDVVCVVGRMRPIDREYAMMALLGNQQTVPRFIVGTQALEVGVDYDCQAMVTELAPASALAQRFGRVNRFGRFDEAEIIVFDSEKPLGPYSREDLDAARIWLSSFPDGNASAWAVSVSHVPSQSLRRTLFQRLEKADVAYFSHTSESLAAETGAQGSEGEIAGLDLWIRDEIGMDSDHDLMIAVRENLPSDDVCAAGIVSRIPPVSDELFPCGISQFRSVMEALGVPREEGGLSGLRFFVSEDGESYGSYRDDSFTPKPGMVCVLDAQLASIFKGGIVYRGKGKEGFKDCSTAEDVYWRCVEKDGLANLPFEIDGHVLGSLSEGDSLLIQDALAEIAKVFQSGEELADEADEDSSQVVDSIWQQMLASIDDAVFAGFARHVEFVPLFEETGRLTEVIAICKPNISSSMEEQVEIADRQAVSLRTHSDQVASETERITRTLGVNGWLQDALVQAALLHDEGKRDSRFQAMLHHGKKMTDDVLAKSLPMSRTETLDLYRKLGLAGWRHEQLSAAIAWKQCKATNARNLITRLVGTTHGRGRSTFDCSGSTLTRDEVLCEGYSDSMEELFDCGLWEWLIQDTNDEFGYWRCAYLEAVLRAADIRISAGDGV